jgi:hypothetical protein
MNVNLSRAVWAALSLSAAAHYGAAEAVTVRQAATVKPAAVVLTTYVDITSVPASNVLYIGGSTAIDSALKYWSFNTGDTSVICKPGTASVYSQSATSGTAFTAVACLASGAAGLTGIAADTPIAYIKEDTAGSLNGAAAPRNQSFAGSPYTNGGGLNFPNYSNMVYASSGATGYCTGGTKAGTGLQTYASFTCKNVPVSSVSGGIVPQLGFSDVEAGLFGINTAANVNGYAGVASSGNTLQFVFGVVTNVGLYRALQATQGLTQNDLVANMPSLTRPEISALLSNRGPNWSKWTNTSGTAVSSQSVVWGSAAGSCWNGATTLTIGCPASAAAAASSTVFVCRRGATSGTQLSAEIFFNDKNCGFNQLSFTTTDDNANPSVIQSACTTYDTDGCSWLTTYASGTDTKVFPGNGGGDLIDCLNGHDKTGHLAIGFASVDNLTGADQSNTGRRDFRYIKVDGVVPSIENAAAGRYQYISNAFWYAPPAAASWSAAQYSGSVAGLLLTYLTDATQGVGSKGSIAGVNAASQMAVQGFHGGVLVIPSASNLPLAYSSTQSDFNASPISAMTKAISGTNNCIRPTLYNQSTNSIVTGGSYQWVGP